MFALGALDHLILAGIRIRRKMADIRDVHDTLYIIACILQGLDQRILHDIGTDISDVSEVVNRRTTGVHGDLALFIGLKILNSSAQRIIKSKHGYLPASHFISTNNITDKSFRKVFYYNAAISCWIRSSVSAIA